jgi:hypothetical protein
LKTTLARLKAFIKAYPRLAITGAPSTGKTTLTLKLDDGTREVFHNDDFKHLEWSKASEHIAKEINDCDKPLIVEGVTVPRALRKGMKVDAVIWLSKPHIEQKPGQVAMGKGCQTVLNEWRQSQPGVPVFHWEEEAAQ